MTDRGMIFAGSSVRAMIEGRKTQSRRFLKPQPPAIVTSAGVISRSTEGQTDEWSWLSGDPADCDTWGFEGDFRTGYRPDDRLWVREAWRAGYDLDWYREDLGRPPRPSEFDPATTAVEYLADGERELGGKDRSCLHMPRWASRLTLTIEAVNVERLQSISEADAIAEGVSCWMCGGKADGTSEIECGCFHSRSVAVQSYQVLWDSLHTKTGERWEDNPWVVAVTFSVVRGNIDQVAA